MVDIELRLVHKLCGRHIEGQWSQDIRVRSAPDVVALAVLVQGLVHMPGEAVVRTPVASTKAALGGDQEVDCRSFVGFSVLAGWHTPAASSSCAHSSLFLFPVVPFAPCLSFLSALLPLSPFLVLPVVRMHTSHSAFPHIRIASDMMDQVCRVALAEVVPSFQKGFHYV